VRVSGREEGIASIRETCSSTAMHTHTRTLLGTTRNGCADCSRSARLCPLEIAKHRKRKREKKTKNTLETRRNHLKPMPLPLSQSTRTEFVVPYVGSVMISCSALPNPEDPQAVDTCMCSNAEDCMEQFPAARHCRRRRSTAQHQHQHHG